MELLLSLFLFFFRSPFPPSGFFPLLRFFQLRGSEGFDRRGPPPRPRFPPAPLGSLYAETSTHDVDPDDSRRDPTPDRLAGAARASLGARPAGGAGRRPGRWTRWARRAPAARSGGGGGGGPPRTLRHAQGAAAVVALRSPRWLLGSGGSAREIKSPAPLVDAEARLELDGALRKCDVHTDARLPPVSRGRH